jgi:hypothetical protein
MRGLATSQRGQGMGWQVEGSEQVVIVRGLYGMLVGYATKKKGRTALYGCARNTNAIFFSRHHGPHAVALTGRKGRPIP